MYEYINLYLYFVGSSAVNCVSYDGTDLRSTYVFQLSRCISPYMTLQMITRTIDTT